MDAPPALGPRLDRSFFDRPVAEVAPGLIGCALLVDGVGGVIVETERYQQDDPASHSFRGPRGRARIMFGPPGRLYVYRSYGIHWCANLVCEGEGTGAAVLLRALEPVDGVETMRARRGLDDLRVLAAGPGRLCQALGVTREHDGLPLDRPPFELRERDAEPEIVRGPRIGITRARELPWRFAIAGSPFLSRPLR
jgi:DNA-3-methyladenine glycosylase